MVRRQVGRRSVAALLAAMPFSGLVPARAAETEPEPIRIGFGEALTGSLAVIGKTGILAMQIWADKVNAAGGLLGRPVKLVYYDNQSNPANVPGIYIKLLDVDHVDFVLSGYSTNMAAPAMPIVIDHHRLYLSVFSLASNSEFHYPRCFAMIASGPDPKRVFSQGFFDLLTDLNPRPETIAIVGADSEFARNATDGARANAKAAGLKIVYDSSYPPTTIDYAPVVRAVRSSNPDVIFVASYPTDTAGILRNAAEMGLKARLFGGPLVGLATASMKTQLGPLLNGIVLAEQWVPAPALQFPGVMEFLQVYQSKAPAAGVDPLGVFLPPFAYARMQVLEQAVNETKTLDETRLADYIRTHTFKTVVGEISFGQDGEWAKSRMIWTQFQGIKNHDLAQFKDSSTEVVLLPKAVKSGELVTPFQAGNP